MKIIDRAWKRRRASKTGDNNTLAREASIPVQQHLASKEYTHTTISGNAGVVQGDVYNYYHAHNPQHDTYNILLKSLTFPRMEARLRNLAAALPTTCEWLVSHPHFSRWANRSHTHEHHGFLWIKGKPGSGKSTIMKETLAWAQRQWPTEIVISYFFNARSPDWLEKSCLGLYRSLLHRLLLVRASTHASFLDRFASKEKGGEIEDWTETELQNFLLELAAAGELSHVNIFIDALDEGKDDDIRRMVGFLEHLTQRMAFTRTSLRICLSSRHYPHIRIRRGLNIILEDEPRHSVDIEAYVRKELTGDDGAWMQELRRKVCARSAGVFLWVVLVVIMLNEVYDRGRGLRAMLKKLDEIPSDLRQVYDKILSAASEEVHERIKLLQWVLVAKRPLRPSELYSAAHYACSSADMDDVVTLSQDRLNTWLVNCSCGLLETIEVAELDDADDLEAVHGLEGPVVQFIHETVRDYLLDRKAPGEEATAGTEAQVSRRVFQEDICHFVVAEDSLRYCLDLPKGAPSIEDIVAQRLVAEYAASYWWEHMREKNNMCDQKLVKLALQLLTDRRCLLLWVQLCDPDNCYRASSSLTLARLAPSLYYAASLGLSVVVNRLLEQKADVNAKGGEFGNALQAASHRGHEKVVQILLGQGANINAQGGHWGNALQAASISGLEEGVQILLDRGADVNARGSWGSAVETASINGHEKVVQVLLRYGARSS
ncbi:hypothetical protein LTR70_007477 [Exophiala xenobiotica]|uniref:Nephrocystin 3-like N-terminal domain-containing protein n=1 Tax=Lithohypha guttulata TaxID=1690604 RepID=A0ABR0KQP1_9EURO|nr:hypothetical protein LTR24_000398 [Lithohypha guttulata]KAK5313708.1 hypothetical protein LTR70_007477 [Exophiala xenobiotica]